MESIVEALNNAYLEFVAAATDALEARELAGGQKTAASEAALEAFKQRWELFRVSCDQAEEFVESMKQRIGSECLVDEATGIVPARPGQATSGIPPISAVRLEQMSKAVRWLVLDLQQGSGAAAAAAPSVPHLHSSAHFDSRFSEDSTQLRSLSDSMKQRIGLECLVDEATSVARPGHPTTHSLLDPAHQCGMA